MYNLLIHVHFKHYDPCTICWSIFFLSRQSMPFPCSIFINFFFRITLSNNFCQYMAHAHNSSSLSKVRFDFILSIPLSFPLLYPIWSPSTSSIFLSILHPCVLAITFAARAMVAVFCRFLLLLQGSHCKFNGVHGPKMQFHICCNINSQLDATIKILLIISIGSTCFGWYLRSSSRAPDCIYSLWYNAPAVLPAGDKDGVDKICREKTNKMQQLDVYY